MDLSNIGLANVGTFQGDPAARSALSPIVGLTPADAELPFGSGSASEVADGSVGR
ncbi:MAG TPA: hypothetical protein VLD62_04180 [Acidimicrobiia bacterium]|nr:hypothetical protein [Acidimicrobiia bacterium]